MTKVEKELLLKDLCARLPYHTIVNYRGANVDLTLYTRSVRLEDCKPYLRPLSSMTKEEREIYNSFFWNHYHDWDGHSTCTECVKFEELPDFLIFCYKHHLDIWGLIPMGLALKAPEDMYKTE